jgi:hypothetical protein
VRRLAVRIDTHSPFAVLDQVFIEGLPDMLRLVEPTPLDQREIALAHAAFAEVVLQANQRRTFLADDEQTRGFPVQTVRQLKELGVGSRPTQLFDNPEADAATTVHRNACRLVNDQHRIVLEHDRKITCGGRRLAILQGPWRHPYRWHPHLITQLQAVICLDPALIYPDLTAAQNAIDVTIRHTLAHF